MAKKKTADAAPATQRRRTARTPNAVPPPVDGIVIPEPRHEPEPEPQPEPKAATGPSPDDIAHEAYLRYLRRGGDHGRDFDDWLEAERELRSRK